MTLDLLTANLTGRARREKLQGREHLVVPVSMIVPGVLNGSRGPGYYPLEEIQKNPSDWNGMPLVLDHPYLNGQPVSARTKDILNRRGLGVLLNATANGKLAAEAWFDITNTEEKAPGLIEALESRGERVEVSTGLGLDPDFTVGNFQGVEYEFVARNYKPDHLAVFYGDGKRGACSTDAGCGLMVNEEDQQSILSWIAEKLGFNAAGQPRDSKGRFSSGGSGGGGGSSSDIEEAKPKIKDALASGPKDLRELGKATGIKEGRGSDPLSSSLNKALVEMRDAGEISVDLGRFGDPVFKLTDNENQQSSNGENIVNRDELITTLIANCECWSESDRETLNEFEDDRLKKLLTAANKARANEKTLNSLKTDGIDIGGAKFAVNAEGDKITVNAFPPPKGKKSAGKMPMMQDDEDEEEETPTAENAVNRLAPDEIEAINFGRRAMAERKTFLVNQLTANIKDASAKTTRAEKLNKMDIDALEEQFQFFNEAGVAPKQEPVQPTANYYGAGAPAPSPKRQEVKQEDFLGVPVINWERDEAAV